MTETDGGPAPKVPEEDPARPGRKRTEILPEVRAEILRLKKNYGAREIAKRVGLSRKLVRNVLEEAKAPSPASSGPAPESASRSPASEPATAVEKASLLDPYRERIRVLVGDGITASRILREIRGEDRTKGYQGGKTILVDYVRKLRAEIAPVTRKKVRRRFETDIGKEQQIDWSPYDVSIGGEIVRVHALGVLLCWSRKLYLSFFRDEKQSSLLEGLAEAADYFQGVAERWVLDNMATAVCGRIGPDRKVLWNPRFAEFTEHMGFDAFACLPGDPDRKGNASHCAPSGRSDANSPTAEILELYYGFFACLPSHRNGGLREGDVDEEAPELVADGRLSIQCCERRQVDGPPQGD